MPSIRSLRAAFAAACACLTFATFAAPASAAVTPNGRLQIYHLDVGQGDGALIVTPLGQVVMIDNGVSPSHPTAMGKSVVQQLQALGVNHIDHHFASHYHSDHIGNTVAIVSAGIPITNGWDRGGSYTTATYTNYKNTLGVNRKTLVKNQVITLDSLSAHPVTIKVVDLAGAGASGVSGDENALCLMLKVKYGEFDETFGGDLPGLSPQPIVEPIVATEIGTAEVYKVHHHGSATSSDASILAAIQAQLGVISCGNGNSYGHPTASALTRLHNANMKTYWTETGAGVAPVAGLDYVASGQVYISATWEPAGVDTIRNINSTGGNTFVHTFINSGTPPGDLIAPLASIASPDGGESWLAGSSHAITWNASDNVGVTAIDLSYSTDGGFHWTSIASGLANSGSYSWTVPSIDSDSALVRVTAYDAANLSGYDVSNSLFAISLGTTGVGDGALALALSRPAPNPSATNTRLSFTLPREGHARLEVLDLSGRRVWSIEGEFSAGRYSTEWNGRASDGSRVGAGLYFVRLSTPFGTRMDRLARLQ